MAKVEAEVVDSFLQKKSQPSQCYYYIHGSIKDYEQQSYLIVPLHPKQHRLRKCISCKCYCTGVIIFFTILLLFITLGALVFWPSQPKLEIDHIHLNHINVSESVDAIIFFDTSMDLKVMIGNQDLISHNYNLISILIGYHGTWLESTTTHAAFVNARSTSYIEATIRLNGTQALKSSLQHHDEITSLFVPLEILIEVGAEFHIFSTNVPIQGRMYCLLDVDVTIQAIAKQVCYRD